MFGFLILLGISFLCEKIKKKWLKVLIFFVKFILMTGLALALIAFASPFLWKFNYPLLGIYAGLLADCICDVLMAVYSLFRKKRTFAFRTAVLGIITVLVSAYGTVNSQIIRKDRLQVTSL